MNNRHKNFIVTFIILLVALTAFFIFPHEKDAKAKPETTTQVVPNKNRIIATTTTAVNGYMIEFVLSSVPDEQHMTDWSKILIVKDGKNIFETDTTQEFSGFYAKDVGDSIRSADEIKIKAIKDVTGDGTPELVFSSYSGGSHCCSQNYVIGLTGPLHFYLNLYTGDYGIEFEDLDKDGKMEIKTYESVFSYWHASFGSSAMPPVILSLQGSLYRADTSFMRQPAPSDTELQKKADAVSSWSSAESPEPPWNYVIDLIYSGNISSARKYVDMAWRDGGEFKSKDDFWIELTNQIHTSPYYADLKSHFGI